MEVSPVTHILLYQNVLHCRLRFPINNFVKELFNFSIQQSVKIDNLAFTLLFKNGLVLRPPNRIQNANGQ